MLTRTIIFKTPDIPESYTSSIDEDLFDIKLLDPVSGYSGMILSGIYAVICGESLFKDHEDTLIRLGISEKTVIVITGSASAPTLLKEPLVYDTVRKDEITTLNNTLVNLTEVLQLKEEYRKANVLNQELLSIGIALSAERNNNKLLNDILFKIRQITKADAGSLYLLEEVEGTGEKNLLFKIAHNDSNPSDFSEFRMSLNTRSIAGYVAVTSETLNIPDVYMTPESEPYSFNKSYDIATDYRSRSMLTVPMLDHHENIIGVVQLINRKRNFSIQLKTPEDVEKHVEPFDAEDENIVMSLASQAAVSLENNILYSEIETLFEGFVAASVKAIESRDPTTSGHSSRVASYSLAAAEAINKETEGVFADVIFTGEQMKELRYAGLLHDFGKVGVREAVLVKAKKLYPGQLDIIKMRLAYIRKCAEVDYLKDNDEERYRRSLKDVEEALNVIIAADEPAVSRQKAVAELTELNRMSYITPDGSEDKWLTDYEFRLLSIERGSLDGNERKEIESHVVHSYEFLQNIPWTSSLKKLPIIARGHHERIDGTGYPDGISAGKLSLRSRIMAVADIFDALTARDRPYKKALSSEMAIKIINEEADSSHLDRDVVDIFIKKKIYRIGEIK